MGLGMVSWKVQKTVLYKNLPYGARVESVKCIVQQQCAELAKLPSWWILCPIF